MKANGNSYVLLKLFILLDIYTLSTGFSVGKESTCNPGDLGSIPGLGRSPGEGKDHPLQYSGLESSVDYTVAELDTTEPLSFVLSASNC